MIKNNGQAQNIILLVVESFVSTKKYLLIMIYKQALGVHLDNSTITVWLLIV